MYLEKGEDYMSYVALSQGYAVNIEHILWAVFSCERYGIGGIVNADYIRKYPIASMIHAVTYLYASAGSNKKGVIEEFIENIRWYSRFSIDDLLSFEAKERVIDGTHYVIDCKNGKEQLDNIIKEFKKIIDM